ncbi:hypothetical protein [Deinococcus sp. Marseille-Q6407]|uniref:hypothetical protein n=1 Tax=Deinococcus sp. Marseille-Q6407 TaxID=2969223 RepID=UPI0021BFF430|nr:hypothetical protein [Deinococcus sp. Marseille-Q6407]
MLDAFATTLHRLRAALAQREADACAGSLPAPSRLPWSRLSWLRLGWLAALLLGLHGLGPAALDPAALDPAPSPAADQPVLKQTERSLLAAAPGNETGRLWRETQPPQPWPDLPPVLRWPAALPAGPFARQGGPQPWPVRQRLGHYGKWQLEGG